MEETEQEIVTRAMAGHREGIMEEVRHKRKQIWVDVRFQATYTLIIVGVAVALLAVLGTLYVRTLAEQRELMGVDRICLGAVPVSPNSSAAEFDEDLERRLREEDLRTVLFLVGGAGLLVIALAILGIRLTFRVAGPARALSRSLRHLAEGRLEVPRKLRKGDHFQFLERDVKAIHGAMKRDAEEDAELMTRAAEALQAQDTPRETRLDLADRLAGRAQNKSERFLVLEA